MPFHFPSLLDSVSHQWSNFMNIETQRGADTQDAIRNCRNALQFWASDGAALSVSEMRTERRYPWIYITCSVPAISSWALLKTLSGINGFVNDLCKRINTHTLHTTHTHTMHYPVICTMNYLPSTEESSFPENLQNRLIQRCENKRAETPPHTDGA